MGQGMKNAGIQVAEFLYDFSVDGGATGVIDLSGKSGKVDFSAGTIILGAVLRVVTTCESLGSATVAVGNSANDDGYLEAIAVASLAANAVFNHAGQTGALLWDNTNDCDVPYQVTSTANTQDVGLKIGTAALTAGKILVSIMFLRPSL